MSERVHHFRSAAGPLALALPFDLDEVLQDWASLRARMTRGPGKGFTRDEWAYLIAFLDAKELTAQVQRALGVAGPPEPGARPALLLRPGGDIAVWLPSNVSLLGPLTAVLLTLTGNRLWLKAGSGNKDLTSAFLGFAREHLPAGALREHLAERVRVEAFDRDDPRNREMAATAAVRIVFGSDEAAAAIHALPSPAGSIALSFSDRRSEAWLDVDAADDATVQALIKVFAIYGQAGCTSPRRVVLLDSAPDASRTLAMRMAAAWPAVVGHDVPMHVASGNVMAAQWSAALGWESLLPDGKAAVLALGSSELPAIDAPLFLPIVSLSTAEAVASLPANVQTIGCAFSGRAANFAIQLAARTRVKRVVPIARMHAFGAVWDGRPFWRETFEEVLVES